jgi:putative polyhydroxyalkanoate system protein
MADLDIKRAHNLGMNAAPAAADRPSAQLGRKFGPQRDWSGHVLDFGRPGVTGIRARVSKELLSGLTQL